MDFKKVNKVFTIIALCLTSSLASADSIKDLKVKDIDAYIKSHSFDKPLIIHFSSNDKSCGPCLIDNGGLAEASYVLDKIYNIAEVNFQPWGSVSKHKDLSKKYMIIGLPTSVIIYKGKLEATQSGALDNRVKSFTDMWNKRFEQK